MGKSIVNTTCHCTRLRRSAETVASFYDRYMRPAGVTAQQYAFLRQVQLHPGCSMRELSGWVELDRSTLTRSLKSLFKNGCLTDCKEHGTRNSRLYLTTKGEGVYSQAKLLWEKAQRDFERHVGLENVEQLELILLKLQDL